MPGDGGHGNLIPAAASKFEPRRKTGPRSDTAMHLRFVIWAMQQPDIDSVSVRRVAKVMRVAVPTAQRLRELWRDITATRFYHDSVPDIVNVLAKVYRVGNASNDG